MEIEIKAKIEDKSSLESKIKELGGVFQGRQKSVDTYYFMPGKPLTTRTPYFRIRENGEELIFGYYVAHDEIRSDEFEVKLGTDQFASIEGIILALGYRRLKLQVIKQRDTYKLDGAKIEIDQVEHLGLFVEIEIITDDNDNAAKRVKQIAGALGIKESDFSSLRYPEMIWQRQKIKIGTLFNPIIHNI